MPAPPPPPADAAADADAVTAVARRWQAVSALLDEALDLPPAQRAVWLAALPARAPDLAEEVARLLSAHATGASTDALARLPALGERRAPDSGHGLQPGQRIGPWALVSLLGTGGMAVVWLARRADGAYQREVALKLPQRLPWRDDLAERLMRERDILARLEHPHIARLYDAGVAASAQGVELPWLAMERVHGEPLHRWCDQRQLGLRERIKLFLQVLDAVGHAHAALVLHRDLKPSNILVTEAGAVKLLDFGIAKLLDAQSAATVDTRLTRWGGQALTPDYASPEQVRGEALTTASDVYSLGVVLYELLCGEQPYRLHHHSAAQLETAVLEGHVRRPSTRPHAQAAEARGLSSRRLSRQLRGELDAIVLAMLRKQPAERYGSVAAVRADLERWLDGLPVQVRADSAWSRGWRFVRRHQLGVGVTAAVLLLLATTTAVSVRQSLLAEREAARARATRDFLAGLYQPMSWLSGNPARGQQVSARELLDLSAQRLREHPIADAEVHRDVLATLGELYGDLGATAPTEALARELVAHTRAHFGERSPEHFDALVRWSLSLNALDLAAAGRALAQAEALLPVVPGDATDMRVRYWLARGNLSEDSDQARAEQAFSQAIALLRDRPEQAGLYSRGLTGLARVRWLGQARYVEARELYEQALAALRADPATPPFWLTKPQAELADVLIRLGDYTRARSLYEEAHERSRVGLGAAHTDTIQTGLRLAQSRRATGQLLSALALLDQLQADLTGPDRPRDVYSLPSLLRERGETLWALGRWREAAADLQAALAGLADRDGAPRISDASVLWRIGLSLAQAAGGQPAAARASLAQAQQAAGQLGPPPRVSRALARGEALLAVLALQPGDELTRATAALQAWQTGELALLAQASEAQRARVQATVALWRAQAHLFAGQWAPAQLAALAALNLLTAPVVAQIGGQEQAQARALLAEARWHLGQRSSACADARAALVWLVAQSPAAPETALAAALSQACQGSGAIIRPSARDIEPHLPWRARWQALR